jgi:hypothetical protein
VPTRLPLSTQWGPGRDDRAPSLHDDGTETVHEQAQEQLGQGFSPSPGPSTNCRAQPVRQWQVGHTHATRRTSQRENYAIAGGKFRSIRADYVWLYRLLGLAIPAECSLHSEGGGPGWVTIYFRHAFDWVN